MYSKKHACCRRRRLRLLVNTRLLYVFLYIYKILSIVKSVCKGDETARFHCIYFIVYIIIGIYNIKFFFIYVGQINLKTTSKQNWVFFLIYASKIYTYIKMINILYVCIIHKILL